MFLEVLGRREGMPGGDVGAPKEGGALDRGTVQVSASDFVLLFKGIEKTMEETKIMAMCCGILEHI